VSARPGRIGIVVASDIAKYELESTGEYTQGAGAVAILVKSHPRLMRIHPATGVATESVHDFYKPRREKFTETPVFDGQYSNQCYQDRMTEALEHFRQEAVESGLFKAGQFPAISDRWARMAFHLPYSFHAKRIYTTQFIQERKQKDDWEKDVAKYGFQEPERAAFPDEKTYAKAHAAFLKSVSESAIYRKFVKEKLEKAQRASSETGNLYTASIFLALMSTLSSDLLGNVNLKGKRIGFVAYGSGSKAKIFEGVVLPGWGEVVKGFQVFEKLNNRKSITYDSYIALHNGCQQQPEAPEKGRWKVERIGTEGVTLGARYYGVF